MGFCSDKVAEIDSRDYGSSRYLSFSQLHFSSKRAVNYTIFRSIHEKYIIALNGTFNQRLSNANLNYDGAIHI